MIVFRVGIYSDAHMLLCNNTIQHNLFTTENIFYLQMCLAGETSYALVGLYYTK